MILQAPDTAIPTLMGVMLAALLVNVALVIYARRKRPSAATAGRIPGHATSTDAAIQCPSCGAENRAGYRYCRQCITELPGGAKYTPHVASSFGRGIR